MHLKDQMDDKMSISITQFLYVFLIDLPHIPVSGAERGICDVCMDFRHKLRMVEETHVQCTAERYTIGEVP